jgi:antitoxin ParD1/3/4
MARTMTVDVGDELREFIDWLRPVITVPRAKSCETQAARETGRITPSGTARSAGRRISSGEAKPWNKNAFLRNVRARVANERD